MSYLIATTNGNLTAAGTWALVDANSVLDSEANNTALTTSYVNSQTWLSPGITDTIDGIAVKLASVVTGTGGTMSVALDQGGATVTGTEVTVNIADLPVCSTGAANNEGGWFFFDFSTPVTLLLSTTYSIKAKVTGLTGGAAVNLFRDATAGNWSRLLRTTTAQAPGAADLLIIVEEWTGPGTGITVTVTMDSTSATAILVGAGASGAINIGKGGTLSWGTTASTAYKLTVGNGTTASDIRIYSGGSWLANAPPSSSSHDFVMNVTAGQADALSVFSVRNGGTATGTGATVATVETPLTSDASAAATTLNVGSTSGWAAGDLLGIASTSRTAAECESTTISTVATGTSVTVPAITNAHVGTAPMRSEVVHLTRNIKMRSNQTALGSTGSAAVDFKPGSIVNFDYVEFSYLGGTAAGTRGVEVETTTGSCLLTHCSLHDFRNYGLILSTANGNNNVTISDTVCYNLDNTQAASSYSIQNALGSVITRCYFVLLGAASNGSGIQLPAGGAFTFTWNTIVGLRQGFYGISVSGNNSVYTAASLVGNVVHSCAVSPFANLTGDIVYTLRAWAFWRNNGAAITFAANNSDSATLDACSFWGNASAGQVNTPACGLFWMNGCTVRGDATLTVASGLAVTSGDVYITDGGSNTGATVTTTASGGAITAVSGWAGGANYQIGQVVAVSGGNGDALLQITAVAQGVPSAATIVAGGTGYTSVSGVALQSASTFGAVVTHTTQDVVFSSTTGGGRVFAWNTAFLSATVAGFSGATFQSGILRSHKHGRVATAHRAYSHLGTITTDNTHLDTGQTVGIKCTPTASASASRPCIFPGPTTFDTERIDVLANPSPALSVTVYVCMPAHGGTGVTLHVVGGPVAGVGSWGSDLPANTVSDSASFQALTVSGINPTEQGELEFYLSADSSTTVFWVGHYAISAAPAVDTTAMQVIARGLPAMTMHIGGGGTVFIGGGMSQSAIYTM